VRVFTNMGLIANVRHSRLYECAVRVMRKKILKLSSKGGGSGSKKCKEDYRGVCRSLRVAGV
jgi:hypothetical protein